MNRLMKISLVVLAAAVLLSACAFNRNALIGSWKEDASGIILQFTVDGKMIQTSSEAPGSSVENGYQFINDDTILLIGSQNVLTYKVEGDKLILSMQDQSLTLSRAK